MRPEDRLAAIGGMRVLGFSITMPFAGLALQEDFGLTLGQVSAFYVALAAAGALGQVLGGLASDRVGRVRSMVLGGAVASASLTAAVLLWAPAVVELMIAVQAFFSNVYSVASMALVGNYFNEHRGLVSAYGRVRVGSNLGWAVGIAVGGVLYSWIGFKGVVAVTSLLLAASLVPLVGLREPSSRGGSLVMEAPSRQMAIYLVPTFLTFIIAGLMGYPLVQYLSGVDGISTRFVGALLAVNGFMVVLLQDAIARRLGLVRPSVALATGMAVYGVGYAFMAFVRSLPEAAADIVIITLGEMIVMPVSSAVAAELSSPRSRGSHMGFYGIVNTLARNLSSSIYAESLYLMGPWGSWGLMSAVSLASSLGYLLTLGL